MIKDLDTKKSRHQQAKAKLVSVRTSSTTNPTLLPLQTPTHGPEIGTPDKFDSTRDNLCNLVPDGVVYFPIDVLVSPRRGLTQPSTLNLNWATSFINKALAKADPIMYNKLIKHFMAFYFNLEEKEKAELTLWALRQTSLVVDYTHTFMTLAADSGWEVLTLISLYNQGLKKDIQLDLITGSMLKSTDMKRLCNNQKKQGWTQKPWTSPHSGAL
ncbi:uncharacterized protein VP01_4370g1 [Puccinia sorghi]|uniref:Retrotransposon gag domain-containing protein n=1 Tax=Puccinia sorghi TaxID=27349 RepID=A0A0L6URR2_9BASI|nr:uncharacterized protein VP01_4370g1 [Puccinia sorghi]